jgi:heptosyltransferase II
LIRLPNWLGDMVMSSAFVKAVAAEYPQARLHLVAKKGIDFLLDYFPAHEQRYIFSKEDYKGLKGAWRFGKNIGKAIKFDLCFCLPDSFSSAVMARASGAKKIIGYKKELRSLLLTNSYNRPTGLHRVEDYLCLLEQFTGKKIPVPTVELLAPVVQREQKLVININSEAESRRLPATKAISLINTIKATVDCDILLVGSPKEKPFVDAVYAGLKDTARIINVAGQTNLPQLMQLFATVSTVLTTDSGPAHVANALGTHTIVLFGAGNEHNTAPYNKKNLTVIRLGKLSCEPCVNNTCKRYGVPECLLQLDEQLIAAEVKANMKI